MARELKMILCSKHLLFGWGRCPFCEEEKEFKKAKSGAKTDETGI